jgi:formate hydrogenlyase subunit 3/multisubunit Na+/H+ antiporter MnhD subunit
MEPHLLDYASPRQGSPGNPVRRGKLVRVSVTLFALIVGIIGGFGLGKLASILIGTISSNPSLAPIVGVVVWILSTIVFVMYSSLWLVKHGFNDIQTPPASESEERQLQRQKSKVATAEIRVALVFGFIAGAAADNALHSIPVTAIAAISFAVAGGVLGHDFKRRARKLGW